MSSSEDQPKGKPPEPPEPPDSNPVSSTGPSNEPTPQAHSVSQTQGDSSHPTSPAKPEHGKPEDDVPAVVEAHVTLSQESNVSSIDPYSLPVEEGTIEDESGKTEDPSSSVDPEAAQTPATTTPVSNPQTTAMATTTTTQSVALTTTSSNAPNLVANPASQPETEAKQALPVPGLTDPSPEELDATPGSHVSPEQFVQTAIEGHFISHSMSGLQLGGDSVPGMGPVPENIVSGGPGPSPDVSNLAAQHPLSSTPNQPLTEQRIGPNVSATTSIEQLGSTISAPDSTLSVPGFESASDLFSGETGSNVPAVQSTDPGMSGLTDDSEMVQDPAREGVSDMDTTHQNAYSQKGESTPPGSQPGPGKLSSPEANQALQLMGRLFHAHQAGNLADVADQLQGPQAEQLRQLMQLAQSVAKLPGTGQEKTPNQSGTDPNPQPETIDGSGNESGNVRDDASENRRCESDQPVEDDDQDVIILDEQDVAEGLVSGQTILWGGQAEPEQPTEADWANRFPIRKPFLKPLVKVVDDNWYQGEDCFDPSRIAPAARRAILPAADGSLALRNDAAMPGASRGRTKYRTHDLERKLSFPKGVRLNDKLPPINSAELIARDQAQTEGVKNDEFWQDQIYRSQYVPGPYDTPVNFAVRMALGRVMAIPYRVIAPMAWEYPYAYGQLQESITDRLVPASLYGMQLVRPGYTSPQAGPEVYPESEWLKHKSEACANYILDTDTAQCGYGAPFGSIGTSTTGEDAFTCSEPGCGFMAGYALYFATAEQYVAHWNTFHVAVAPAFTCLLRGCGVKFAPGPDSLDAFFRHVTEKKHAAESDGGSWRRLKIWARKSVVLAPNPQYWPPSEEPFVPARPSGVQNLDEEDMKDPFKAARWVARTTFQSYVAKARPARSKSSGSASFQGRGRGTHRGRGARPNRGARSSGPGSGSESQGELNPQTTSGSGSGLDSRGRDPARGRGKGRGSGRNAGPSRADASSAGSADESTSKQAPGLRIALKDPKRKRSPSRSRSSDRRKRHSGQDGSEGTSQSSKESVYPRQPKLPASATRITTPRPSGAGSTYTTRTVGPDAIPLGGRRPGDGTVPSSALPVETLEGQLVYEGTQEEPIIKFESCRTELKRLGKAMRLWTIERLETEIAGLKDKSRPPGSWSPWQDSLPRLPEWGSPNGWDYWGRPWAFMDAPNRHPDLKVKSAHHKNSARVTIAVLVNCEREPQ